ncbi:MAG: hypothetical protein ABI693_22890 [Bryobacteraceae bacterium]
MQFTFTDRERFRVGIILLVCLLAVSVQRFDAGSYSKLTQLGTASHALTTLRHSGSQSFGRLLNRNRFEVSSHGRASWANVAVRTGSRLTLSSLPFCFTFREDPLAAPAFTGFGRSPPSLTI